MKTKKIHLLTAASALFCAVHAGGQTNIGQWDFKSGTLAPTIGATALQYYDGTGGATAAGTHFGSTSNLSIPGINGSNVNVMAFPASGAQGGFVMPTPTNANGGGSLVNNYTIVMDVLYPAIASGHVRPLVQTDDGAITPDADLVIDSTGGIGAPPGPYNGIILPNTWYRIAFAVTANTIDEFINGVEVGTQGTGGADSRFALAQAGAPAPSGYALLFQNSTTNGATPGYVSSIQLWNDALSAGQIAALGAVSATKIPTNISAIPSFVNSRFPAPNANNVAPITTISAALNPGGTTINSNSISLALDGVVIQSATVTATGTNFLLNASPTNVLAPYSIHTISVLYSDSVAGAVTNSWTFSVFGYQNVTLPAPIYLETFDEVAEGGVPAGWVVTNATDTLTAGLNLFNTQSDSYKNWVTISTSDYATVYPDTDNYTSPGFPNVQGNRRQMIPPIVENGVFLTNLASSNLIVAESDQRGGSQVQVMFTSDYDFTAYSNVYVSFHMIYEQNQDNIGSVEYSIDQGTNWQPLLYLLDDGSTDADGSDVITNKATGQIDAVATMNTARNDQAHGESYGSFIGAPITQALAPYIRPCRNDDPVQEKRIEVFGLPLAAHQSKVRMRFMQAGTGSWFFDIDNLGFYTIPQPIILVQPTPLVANYNGPAAFNVSAGGANLSFQWSVNGTNIATATNSTYTISNALTNNLGNYLVVVSNVFGAVTSQPIPLSLVYTPVITSSPQEQTIAVGEGANFAVTAIGGQPLSYQWLLNSNAIPGATNTTFAVANATTNNAGYYQVAVSNNFSTVVSAPANLTVFAGPISNSMVVHLSFDGDFNDSSGRGNNGTPVGTPTFTNGFLGQAVHTTTSGTPANAPATNNYISLGIPGDLNFGSDYTGDSSDFSVSFWVKIFQQNDDQSFIGNKDWNSGSNPGWIIDTEGDGMKWNYRDDALNIPGVGSSRRDSPHVAPQLEDHGWHHVLVTMARHSVGKIYVDGSLANTTSLAPDAGSIVGSLDTSGLGFTVNIGQDGTGHYTDGGSDSMVDMLMDDLAIWRRVLTDQEALGIFNAGLNGVTVDKASTSSAGASPSIQTQPADASVQPGTAVQFYAGVLGTPPLSYQWFFGNTAVTGQTNNTYQITNVQAALAGSYTLVVSNSYGAVTSRVANLSLFVLPVITGVPVGETVDPGSTVTFTTTATGGSPLALTWLHNGSPVANSGSAALTLQNVQVSDAGSYWLIASNSLGAATSAVARLNVWSGPVTSNLVAHLTFDGNLADTSGRSNNATYAKNGASASPTARFTNGVIGQAFEYTTTSDASDIEYATFGYPADLQFDSTNDFSVSFWANYTNQSDDLPFISDKDWNSSSNPGWGIFTQSGGNYRINVTGPNGSADKFSYTDTPTTLKDGKWHNVVVSFQHVPAPQQAYVYAYLDGALVSKHPLIAAGTIDTLLVPFTNEQGASGAPLADNQTAWAVNVGQDGTGVYHDQGSASDINAAIDDLGIWRRALTAHEAQGIYQAGQSGQDLTHAVTTTLSVALSGGKLVLTWNANPKVELETTSVLAPSNWTVVPNTLGVGTASITISGTSAYFRLVSTP
jgi:hypothetical protein